MKNKDIKKISQLQRDIVIIPFNEDVVVYTHLRCMTTYSTCMTTYFNRLKSLLK